MLCIFLFLTFAVYDTNSQASQWVDTFQKTLCHDRWAQMDWQSILRPCRYNLEFGKNKYEEKQKTSPKWSHTLGLHFKKTGEFSRIGIQSRTGDGHNKNTGGDTWRVFIRGADRITPFVSDLNNGVYEAKFIALNPGFYKAEVILQSTLCQAFKDPPQDWLKRDATTIISDEKDSELLWTPLRGGNISFKIEDSSDQIKNDLKRSFYRWKDSCGLQYTCNFLWKGFGRWTNSTWLPYVDEGHSSDIDERCYQQNLGVLKLTGDEFTNDIFHSIKNTSFCNGGLFKSCKGEKSGEQPKIKSFEKRDKNSKTFSTKSYLRALKDLLKEKDMDEKSGLVITYGHPFVENMAFKKYRTFVDRAVRILKEKYNGNVVWRTMSSNWKDSSDPATHFKNHQRIQLFNAYATSVMCNAGIPVLDVFQMTESAPVDGKTTVLNNIQKLLVDYFKKEKGETCDKSLFKNDKVSNSTGIEVAAANLTSNATSSADVNILPAGAPTASLTNSYSSTVGNLQNYASTVNTGQIYDATVNAQAYSTTLGTPQISNVAQAYQGAPQMPNVAHAYQGTPQISNVAQVYQTTVKNNLPIDASTTLASLQAVQNAKLYGEAANSQLYGTGNIQSGEFASLERPTSSSKGNNVENIFQGSKKMDFVS